MALLGEVPQLNLRTYRGRARGFVFVMKDGNGDVVNLTGYAFTLRAFDLPITADGVVAGTVVFTAAAPDLAVSDADAGKVTWTFATAQSATLAMGTYGYELVAEIGGETYTTVVGNIYHANTGKGADPI